MRARSPAAPTEQAPARPALPGAAHPPRSGGAHGVTLRAVLIGLLLIPPVLYWFVVNEMVRATGYVTKMSLFYNTLCVLFVLCVGNAVVARWRPRRALSQPELLTIYAMITLAVAVLGLDMMAVLPGIMAHPFRFATGSNKWETSFLPFLPEWLTIHDAEVARAFYEGQPPLGALRILRVWLLPGLAWCGFLLTMLGVMVCLLSIFQRHWIQAERLTFPLVRLPMQMTAEGAPLLRSRLFWTGLAIGGLFDLFGGLNYYYPNIPFLDLRAYRGVDVFTDPPWNATGRIEFGTPPFVVGIGYLLPLPMLFACWFFFLVTRLEMVLSAAAGYGQDPNMPYLDEQTFGAYLGIALIVFWNGHRVWTGALRDAFLGRPRRAPDGERGQQVLSPRVAVLGMVSGLALLVLFARAAGMSLGFALIFFLLFFVLSLALARLRAELGPPVHDLPYASPGEVMVLVTGASALGPANLAVTSLFSWFNRGYRCHPMPILLEGLKMADESGASQRRMMVALLLAGIVSAVVGFGILLDVFYRYGAATAHVRGELLGFGQTTYNRLHSWVVSPPSEDPKAVGFIAGAIVFTLLLNAARIQYAWWPLPPVGYVLQGGWMMRHIWFGLLVAWVVKATLLRYGGLRLYRAALPLFLGLILGEFLLAGFWSLFGITMDIPTYSFWS
jgi:hypothetical protein